MFIPFHFFSYFTYFSLPEQSVSTLWSILQIRRQKMMVDKEVSLKDPLLAHYLSKQKLDQTKSSLRYGSGQRIDRKSI